MAPPHEPDLIALPAAGPDLALEIRSAWDNGDAVTIVAPGAAAPSGPVAPGVIVHAPTSGTTGVPRIAALTHDGLAASAAMVFDALGATASDPWLCCLPLRYVAGLAVLGRAWVTDTPCIVHDGFDAERVRDAIASGEIVYVSLVSTALRRLLDLDAPIDRLRGILLGGGPIDHALVADAHARGAIVHSTYGMTETWGGIVHDGHPLHGVDVRLGGPDNNDIEVRTPTAMRGYVEDPIATAAAFTADGWLRTGDIGAWNADGTLAVVDRRKDVIITGGINVIPSTVDAALCELDGIADAAVYGAPDAEWGERIVACIVLADPGTRLTVEHVRAQLRERIPGPALPREIRIVRGIPKSAGGKVLRRELRTHEDL
jgi:O-succinylbenzoic acid--CoA ligase